MRSFRFVLALVFTAMVGCQHTESNRVPVTGTVESHGKPVARGAIALRPASSIEGPAAGADIVSGKFSIPQRRGPTLGPYLASVTVLMPVDRSSGIRAKFAKFGDVKLQTFEVPMQIKPDETHHDIHLPFLPTR